MIEVVRVTSRTHRPRGRRLDLLRLAELSRAEKLGELARGYATEASTIADECDDARLIEAFKDLDLTT